MVRAGGCGRKTQFLCEQVSTLERDIPPSLFERRVRGSGAFHSAARGQFVLGTSS